MHFKLCCNAVKHTPSVFFGPISSSAYGATLIEHSLIEAGLPGSAKVGSQADVAQGTVETWLITVREQ